MWEEKYEEACIAADLAGAYLNDGKLRAAASQFRDAAGLLEQAVAERDRDVLHRKEKV